MTRPAPSDVASGLLAGLAGVAGSFLVAGASETFVGAPVASAIVRFTPGPVVTVSILTLGDLAQALSFATAIAIVVVAYAALALLAVGIGRRAAVGGSSPVLAGLVAWLATSLLTGAPVSSIGAAVPVGAVVALAALGRPRADELVPGRRRVLALAGAVAGFGGIAYLVRRRSGTGESAGAPSVGGPPSAAREPSRVDTDLPPRLDLPEPSRAALRTRLSAARERSLDVETPSGLVSEIHGFYRVDINSIDPDVDADGWQLRIAGAVDEPTVLDYETLLEREHEHRFVTLRCVGESLNGHKMDTALWTGVPIAPLLEDVTPEGDCECVMLRAEDGYFEEFPLAALRRGLLAYGMNGRVLPRAHGYPVRALIPGHWGEINVKWLTEIELLEREATGYWEQRGWHGTGPVNTVAKLHAVERLGDGRVRVGGHAYAGLRGVSAVEVSTDGGRTWAEATLSDPLPGEDVWRQWAHDLELGGPAEVTVRAVEADGAVQPRDRAEAFPSGPSGWVSKTIDP